MEEKVCALASKPYTEDEAFMESHRSGIDEAAAISAVVIQNGMEG